MDQEAPPTPTPPTLHSGAARGGAHGLPLREQSSAQAPRENNSASFSQTQSPGSQPQTVKSKPLRLAFEKAQQATALESQGREPGLRQSSLQMGPGLC